MISVVESALTSVPAWVAYAAVFALPFLEASLFLGFVFPGETALVIGGVLASQGRLSLPVVIGLAIVGAITGDAVGYAVGRRFGPSLQRSRLGRVVGDDRWRSAEAFIVRRGGPAVFLGRFTALLRALVPSAAGMAHLPYRTFALWNAVGGAVWATAFVVAGYAAGASYRQVEKYLGRGALALTGVVVAGVLVAHLLHRRRATASAPSGR
ncbi:MAG: DedA family protein [Actinobacteria bacterium]|nr:DedA family protein [Actinomycetota bacterium]MCA1721796.1 DedA family protein [Actinomycetota bacterium]